MQHLIFEKKFSQALHEPISKFSYRVAAGVADGVVVAVPSRDTQVLPTCTKARRHQRHSTPSSFLPSHTHMRAHPHAFSHTLAYADI